MKVYHMTIPEVLSGVDQLIQARAEVMIVNFSDGYGCVYGKNAQIREDVCAALDIPILKTHYIGGAIVVFPRDLNIMEFKQGYSRFGENALKSVQKYLRSKGLLVDIRGNDLMIADPDSRELFKVGSFGSNWLGSMTETSVHISINMDVDLIKRICMKPMLKTPGALGVYGITAEELWNVIRADLDYVNVKEEGL